MSSLDQAGARLLVSADNGWCLDSVVIQGEQDAAGRWDLDDRFVLLTDAGEQFSVNRWCRTIGTGVSA